MRQGRKLRRQAETLKSARGVRLPSTWSHQALSETIRLTELKTNGFGRRAQASRRGFVAPEFKDTLSI